MADAKKVKLSDEDYSTAYNRYLHLLLSGKKAMEHIEKYLIKDNIQEKQAKKMLRDLKKGYEAKIEDYLDNLLFPILEVLKKPSKWTFTLEGEITEVFPHPVLNSSNRIIGIQYKANKNYIFTDEKLLNRYCQLKEELEEVDETFVESQARANSVKVSKKEKASEIMFTWLDEHNKGISLNKISKKYGFSAPTVRKYIAKAKEVTDTTL